MNDKLIETTEEILEKNGVSKAFASFFVSARRKNYCICLPPVKLKDGTSICAYCGRVRVVFEILEGEKDEP